MQRSRQYHPSVQTALRVSKITRAEARRSIVVQNVLTTLQKAYPEAQCALRHENPLQLLVATILSAQCTDARVNKVTPGLFRKYRTAADFARAPQKRLEQEIRSTGFYRSKALSIRSTCRDIVKKFRGKVPGSMEELTSLRGVGRKTANVVLGNAFGIPGITVDTHVGRLSRLLGWTRNTDPVKVELDLQKLWPRADWTTLSHTVILHGRAVCKARRPECPRCPVARWCPSRREG